MHSVLEIIAKRVVTSSGKIYGNKEARQQLRREISEILARTVTDFKRGRLSTVYLPPAYPLDGFEYALAPVISENPEETYARLAALLGELAGRARYMHERWREAAEKCVETAAIEDSKTRDFVWTLLSINKEMLLHIAKQIAYPTRMGVEGAITAIYEFIMLNNCAPVFLKCKDIPLGRSRQDKWSKRLFAVARVYDGLLVILGAAFHWDLAKILRHRFRRYESYSLRPTVFTRMFIHALLGNVKVENYISAYRDFVECITSLSERPAEVIASHCAEVLNRWRAAGAMTDDFLVRAVTYTLYDLINSILRP
ncbi:MAG: hypothetical protein LM577_08940 [Thermoproteaceae archaeon]|nr:hypothetical protein [Thermoproteaceae archaeon]